MDMLHKPKRQSTVGGTKKSIGFRFYRKCPDCGRLRWDGHDHGMDPDTWPRKVDKTIIAGNNPRGRPRKTWLQCTKKDLVVKGLDALLVQNRKAWCRAIHSKSRSGCDNGVVQPSYTGNSAR